MKVPFLALRSKPDVASYRAPAPELASEGFARRLREAVTDAGGPAEISRITGIAKRTLAHYLSGETEPKAGALAQLADATGQSADWLLGRSNERAMVQKMAQIQSSPIDDFDLVEVPKLAFCASAGPGRLTVDDHKELIAFPRDILTRAGVRPEDALLAELVGESMSSTIEDGSLVLIDCSRRQVREGKIFAFTVGDEFFVKRLRRDASGALLKISDNSDVFPEEAIDHLERFRVIGQVKWSDQLL